MNKDSAKTASTLINDISTVETQLKRIDNHSFGFGTSYYDIDNFLRPITKTFLKAKLFNLERKLNKLK